jgi:chemosensory pili system protein ChpA (sensor histidine kinase/response regulator)
MSTQTKVDPSTLGWVKNEIDETLKQARLALESFTENPNDKTRLRFCITHLHQVVGTLLMVELDAAAQLAQETEALAEAILNDKAEASGPALEILTRGMLLLPDYLARLQIGSPDMPFKHLALMNEMRAARQAERISELDLFSPDLSVRPPSTVGAEKITADDYLALARQRRTNYQAALLEWLRDVGNEEALGRIGAIFGELQDRAAPGTLEQLFWVGGGLVEALAEGGLETTPERKKFFARLDQQIKKLLDGADKNALRKSSDLLVSGMLFEIGQARSHGPRVTQLKHAFELDKLLAAGEPGADAYDDLPTPEVLQSVSVVLGQEIEAAQDFLAAYFDPQQPDTGALEKLLELLHKMAGTLDMLGVPLLKALVDALLATGRAIHEGQLADPQSASMPMAQALILVENSARDIQHSATEWRQQIEEVVNRLQALYAPDEAGMPSSAGLEVSDAELSEHEFRELVGAVGTEVGVNLSRIEEALEAFAADTSKLNQLDEIPGLLSQIQGTMQILGQERAAELVDAVRRHVEDIQARALAPNRAIMDGLAVCIGTIGAYIDGLRTGRRQIEGLIESALREMEASLAGAEIGGADPAALIPRIQESLEAWLQDPQAQIAAPARLQHALTQLTQAAHDQQQGKIEKISTDMGQLVCLVADGSAALSDEIAQMLRQSAQALADLAQRHLTPPPNAVTAVTPAPASAPVSVELADPEIMQIFIEDARDVFRNISKEFAVWRKDHENQNALTELRRGYHTIKGSGRMVGAGDIAEFAWALENVLNKLRDGKIAFSPAVIDMFEQAQEAIPQLIDQLESGATPTADIATLRASAQSLAQGGGPVTAAAPTASAAPAASRPAVPLDLPKLDGTLLEIFSGEARGHLTVLKQEIAACRDAGSVCLVTPPLFRATHTLAGNARSLNLQIMAEACGEAEKLFHALQAQHAPLDAAQLDLLTQLEAVITELIDVMNNGADGAGDLSARFGGLARAFHAQTVQLTGIDTPAHMPPAAAPIPPTPREFMPEVSTHSEVRPALRPAPAMSAPAMPEATVTEQVDPELIEIFQEEAVDILTSLEENLNRWRGKPEERDPLFELKRALHTLKGGARMAGAMTMGTLSHNTESLLKNVEDNQLAPGRDLFDLLDEVHDTLAGMLERIRDGKPVPSAQALNARLTALLGGESLPMTSGPAAEPETAMTVSDETSFRTPPTGADAAPAMGAKSVPQDDRREYAAEEAPAMPDKLDRRGQIRVNTGLLNELVNYAGEVSISRSRMEQQIYGFRDNMSELSRNIARFRDQLRELEIQSESQILYRVQSAGGDAGQDSGFDPLEFDRFSRLQQLSRSLTESLHDLTTIQNNLGNFIGVAETVLQQQARINTDLQEGLMRTRMVHFSTQAARLRAIVRQTARELDKRVDLDLGGSDVELDRTVLERMIGPFEHMIRNSIDHGIEAEAERRQRGKPVTGQITIATAQEGSEIVIRFSDDGAGLNINAIRAKAVERGLAAAEANLTEDEMVQFILMPGFSTAEKVTHLSGRGVGMDVVHTEVKQLGGTMSVETKRGAGTTFTIRLPLTLSIAQALMVYVGDQQFAVPLAAVANIIEFPVEKLASLSVGKNPLLNYQDQVYPYMHLGQRFGINTPALRNGRKVPVLLGRTGTREVAIQVDGLGGTREVVIKTLGPQLAELKGLAGATILGDGRVVLILDVPGLWYREDTLYVEHRPEAKAVAPVKEHPTVMVVDDSLTVRKVTSKHLQKRGIDVMVAKDGIDAVEQLRERVPDVMLVDIEMPRMDGYELTSRVRGDSQLKHIPIIMITSRAGAKHRQKAFELGVDMYMSKPYQEEELFRNIEALLKKGRTQ